MPRDREVGRGERVLPGLWRLRLPLPLEGVPHCNAWAVARHGGIVAGRHRDVPLGLDGRSRAGAGRRRACAGAGPPGPDHPRSPGPLGSGGAGPRPRRLRGVDAPEPRHATAWLEDPEAALQRRLEIGRQGGVSAAALERYVERIKEMGSGVAALIEPDRELINGVVVDTDLGDWRVYETPGHAPSHVCLLPARAAAADLRRSPARPPVAVLRLRLLTRPGRRVSALARRDRAPRCASVPVWSRADVHRRPGHIDANRELVAGNLQAVRKALERAPSTARELVDAIFEGPLTPARTAWRMTETLCYLRHLEVTGRAAPESDGVVERWRVL